jgi:uncharacterized protein YndB with AHSA1/START domain
MIKKLVLLRCTQERAFALITEQAGQWWPGERRHTQDANSEIHIQASGRFFERSSAGAEVQLGVVREFDRPNRLVLDWYPGSGPANPTQVELVFEAVEGGTRVTVTHDAGAAGPDLFGRNAQAYARSWDLVLSALAGSS